MRRLPVILRLFFALAMPFLLVVAGARPLLSEAFLQFEYGRPGFPVDPIGFTREDRLQYGAYAINYLFTDDGIKSLASLRLPGEKCWNASASLESCAMFSERELRHMEDVKRATQAAFGLALFCALIGVVAALASWRHAVLRAEIAVGIRRGCQLALCSIAALAFFSATAWDQAFDAFHELIFAAGSWRFPTSDSLIRLYPERLFVDAALAIAAFASVVAAACLCLLRRAGL